MSPESPRTEPPRDLPKRLPRRLRFFRILLGAIALSGVLLLVRQAVQAIRWSGFCDRQRDLAAAIAARPNTRTPVPEDPVPGEAWDEYHEAALIIGIIPWARRLELHSCNRGMERQAPQPPLPFGAKLPPIPLEDVDALLAQCADALDHLRAGARRGTATRSAQAAAFPAYWLASFALDLLRASWLRNLSADRRDAALEDFAALIQVGIDSTGKFEPLYPEAVRMLNGSALSAHQLERLDRIYERAESQVPTLVAELEDDRAVLGMTAGADGRFYPENSGWLHDLPPWWLGWSIRLEIARGDIEFRDQLAVAPELDKLAWNDALPRFREADPSYRRFQTRYARWRPEELRNTAAYVRRNRARCRLVRAATMALRGLDATSPAWPRDPFDFEPIRLRRSETEIRVWSPDADGDQGGQEFTNDRYWAKLPSDLVLKVARTPE